MPTGEELLDVAAQFPDPWSQQVKHWAPQLVLPSLGYGLLAFLDKLCIDCRDRTALCLGTPETCPSLFRQSRKGNCSHLLPVPGWLSSSTSTWHKKVPNKWLSSLYLSPKWDMGGKWHQSHCLQSWPAHSWTAWHVLDRNTEKQQGFFIICFGFFYLFLISEHPYLEVWKAAGAWAMWAFTLQESPCSASQHPEIMNSQAYVFLTYSHAQGCIFYDFGLIFDSLSKQGFGCLRYLGLGECFMISGRTNLYLFFNSSNAEITVDRDLKDK